MQKKKKINVENQNRNHKLIEGVERCIVYNFKDPKISGVEKKKVIEPDGIAKDFLIEIHFNKRYKL